MVLAALAATLLGCGAILLGPDPGYEMSYVPVHVVIYALAILVANLLYTAAARLDLHVMSRLSITRFRQIARFALMWGGCAAIVALPATGLLTELLSRYRKV